MSNTNDNYATGACEGALNLVKLWAADEKLKRTRAEWEAAGRAMTIAEHEQRYAELCSQASRYWDKKAFVGIYGALSDREREIALAAAKFIITGRCAV